MRTSVPGGKRLSRVDVSECGIVFTATSSEVILLRLYLTGTLYNNGQLVGYFGKRPVIEHE